MQMKRLGLEFKFPHKGIHLILFISYFNYFFFTKNHSQNFTSSPPPPHISIP